jgi:beta-xylosidase
MTKEEIGELVAALPEGLDADEFIYKLVNWAVDREREACAKVCEEWGAWNNTAQDCAQAIRARKDEK